MFSYLISVSSLLLYDHGYIPLIISTFQFFPNSCINTGFVTRVSQRMPLMKQELLTFRSTRVHPRFLVWFVVLCVVFCGVLQIVVCVFVLFLLAIVLSVRRFSDSDYPFDIIKLFFPLQIVIYDNCMFVSILSNSCAQLKTISNATYNEQLCTI